MAFPPFGDRAAKRIAVAIDWQLRFGRDGLDFSSDLDERARAHLEDDPLDRSRLRLWLGSRGDGGGPGGPSVGGRGGPEPPVPEADPPSPPAAGIGGGGDLWRPISSLVKSSSFGA